MRRLNLKNKFPVRVTCLFPALLLAFFSITFAQAAFAQEDKSEKSMPGQGTAPAPEPPTDISRKFGFLLALEGGGGLLSSPGSGPTAWSEVKIGADKFTLDLGYDRIPAHHGFSGEVSAMFSLLRTPGPQKDATKNYLRIFAEPGLGYRAGGGIGGYGSAKVMMVLLSDHRLTAAGTHWSPFIEAQRRFPFGSPLSGDTRVAFGIMLAICEHCGLD